MSHFNEFANKAAYNDAVYDIKYPAVSLITNTDDIIFDRSIDFLSYLHSDGTVDNTPALDVIGIRVIPATHYGEDRFMSVVNMSENDTTGTTDNEFIMWRSSGSGTDLSSQYNIVGKTLKSSDMINNDFTDFSILNLGYIVSDCNNSRYTETIDFSSTNYDLIANHCIENDNILLSPYNKDLSLNTIYKDNTTHALSDVNGSANTSALLTKSSTNFPAAKVCRSFSPGYKNGE